ncbi:hypothetical protein BX600DRAFT_431291 [Xylariales sp. PMI_506]|nr:hypothetical protein BX600DRAFT_431291 [Xylariales sp. PMI_506]
MCIQFWTKNFALPPRCMHHNCSVRNQVTKLQYACGHPVPREWLVAGTFLCKAEFAGRCRACCGHGWFETAWNWLSMKSPRTRVGDIWIMNNAIPQLLNLQNKCAIFVIDTAWMRHVQLITSETVTLLSAEWAQNQENTTELGYRRPVNPNQDVMDFFKHGILPA